MRNLFICLLLLSPSLYADEQKALQFTQLLFNEVSPGVEPYVYRLLVNDEFIRFDSGIDNDGFILFDRIKKKVFSVNHGDQSRFTISPPKTEYTGKKVQVRTLHTNLPKSPQIQNIKAKLHDIVANETLCKQVLSFEGLLPEITKAWSEYESLIQLQNQQTLDRTPQDMQTDCFIVNNITHAGLFLDFGLPYSVKSIDGTLRILNDYSQVTKPASIVEIPLNYQEFTL